VLWAAVVCAASAAGADDRGTLIQVRAERLANAGNCAEAVELLSAAPEPARSSGEILRLKGKCEIELARYGAAVESLKAAMAADPRLADLDLMIGIALYHYEDFEGARSALEAARTAGTEREAELELYSGLLLLRSGAAREAALALERARRLDAEAVEPVASYYAALAWHNQRERERARDALARTRDNDPDGPWSRQASDALRTQDPASRWWLVLRAGIEYDDNVILRAAEETPRNEDDFRAVWAVSTGARLLSTRKWSGGLLASYSGKAHFEQTDFDLHYPAIGGWLDRRLDRNTLLRFRYDFANAWIDNEAFVSRHLGYASVVRDWRKFGSSELFVTGQHNDYEYNLFDVADESSAACVAMVRQCGQDFRNEAEYRDRDGDGISVGVEQRMPIGSSLVTARGGYTYFNYWADGSEWDYDAHRLHMGVSALLPLDMLFDTEVSYTRRDHRHPSSYAADVKQAEVAFNTGVAPTYASADRRDDIWVGVAKLEKGLTDDVTASARYTYNHSNSNSGFFNYDRHIVGAYLTVRLP